MLPPIEIFREGHLCQIRIGEDIFRKKQAYEVQRTGRNGGFCVYPRDKEAGRLFALLETYSLVTARPAFDKSHIMYWAVEPEFSAFSKTLFTALEQADALTQDRILAQAESDGKPIRLFYGNETTGEDALVIGLLAGRVSRNLFGGWDITSGRATALVSPERIVKITQGKHTLWEHPAYHRPLLEVRHYEGGMHALYQGKFAVRASYDEAELLRAKEFLEGKRNRI